MTNIVLRKCTCMSEYQDRKYGKGIRVHNIARDRKTVTCTVCGTKRN